MRWFFGVLFYGLCGSCFAGLSGSLDEESIVKRIRPVGRVHVQAGEAGTGVETRAQKRMTDSDPIKTRYNQTCRLCHEAGLAGAPRLGKKSEWAPRIAQGIEVLVRHSIDGYKAMPPKGTCVDCSDEEMTKLVEYMVSRSK